MTTGVARIPGAISVPDRVRPRPRVRHWVVFTGFVILAFYALIFSRTTLDDSAFVVQELEGRIEIEESRYWDLRRELAQLQSPDRIRKAATDLGMIYPEAGPHPLTVPGLGSPDRPDPEEQWATLKSVLSAQP